jgi:hypothetical protein
LTGRLRPPQPHHRDRRERPDDRDQPDRAERDTEEDPVPAEVVSATSWVGGLLLCAGMFGLGAAVDLRAVLRSGGRSLAVAATGSTLLVALATAGLLLVA